MKPVSVVEVFTTIIYHSLFFKKELSDVDVFLKKLLHWILEIIEFTTFVLSFFI